MCACMQTQTQTFKSQFSPSVFVWVWGLEPSSSSFRGHHFYLLIHLTGPIIRFWKQQENNIPQKRGTSDMEFACSHPTLDYQIKSCLGWRLTTPAHVCLTEVCFECPRETLREVMLTGSEAEMGHVEPENSWAEERGTGWHHPGQPEAEVLPFVSGQERWMLRTESAAKPQLKEVHVQALPGEAST